MPVPWSRTFFGSGRFADWAWDGALRTERRLGTMDLGRQILRAIFDWFTRARGGRLDQIVGGGPGGVGLWARVGQHGCGFANIAVWSMLLRGRAFLSCFRCEPILVNRRGVLPVSYFAGHAIEGARLPVLRLV